ncbi:MAG: HD-GYP domain-containing protein [Spirochaetaceae bacterium]|nr:HD-GYP domain-containing protein [Spirochaetaceae bacterium]
MPYSVVRRDDELEGNAVRHFTASFVRKITEGRLEVNRFGMGKDSWLSVESSGSSEAVKTYLILSGSCRLIEDASVLLPGDLLVVGELEEFVNLKMLEDCEILAHCFGVPVYEELGKDLEHFTRILYKIQEKDAYTEAHCKRVYKLASEMAEALGYKGKRYFNLMRAARYHDLGKIYVEDGILNKPGPLDETEFAKMREHVVLGAEMVKGTFSAEIFNILSQHHERLDGTGYPRGLSGEDISEEGRILAICDSFDAMVTDRVYKKGKDWDEAIVELRGHAGTMFDPRLVEVFAALD